MIIPILKTTVLHSIKIKIRPIQIIYLLGSIFNYLITGNFYYQWPLTLDKKKAIERLRHG